MMPPWGSGLIQRKPRSAWPWYYNGLALPLLVAMFGVMVAMDLTKRRPRA